MGRRRSYTDEQPVQEREQRRLDLLSWPTNWQPTIDRVRKAWLYRRWHAGTGGWRDRIAGHGRAVRLCYDTICDSAEPSRLQMEAREFVAARLVMISCPIRRMPS